MTKVAVVTGASGGLGQSFVKMLHNFEEKDYRVALHYNHNETAVKEMQKDCPNTFLVQANLSTQEGREKLFAEVNKEGEVEVLINNAGVDKPFAPVTQMTPEILQQLLNVNLFSSVFLSEMFAKEMMSQKNGYIIFISSILAHRPFDGSAAYAMSKAAMETYARYLYGSKRPKRLKYIKTNSIALGFTQTPMTEEMPEELQDEILEQIPSGRFSYPDEVAKFVETLIQRDINGETYIFDGGEAFAVREQVEKWGE